MTVDLLPITEFIEQASEHNCSNVTAALLEYKNEHFTDYDPMERFDAKKSLVTGVRPVK